MPRASKARDIRASNSREKVAGGFSSPHWLTKAVILAELTGTAALRTIAPSLRPAWQLQLASGTSQLLRKTKRKHLGPLPGHFYCGHLAPPIANGSSDLSEFLFWLPKEIAPSELHLIACSRLPRAMHDAPLLIDAIRSVAQGIQHFPAALLFSPQFTLASHLRAVSQTFRIPLLRLSSIPDKANESWFRNRAMRTEKMQDFEIYFCRSPILDPDDISIADLPDDSLLRAIASFSSPRKAPLESPVDWLAVHLASQLHVVSLRPEGNLEAAVRNRLSLPNQNPLSVRILDATQLTPQSLLKKIVRAGAVRWRPNLESRSSPRTSILQANIATLAVSAGSICDREPNGNFLFHWTRAAELSRGLRAELHLSKLLDFSDHRFSPPGLDFPFDSSAFGSAQRLLLSLLQILAEMRLQASGRWTRNQRPVVSLTAQPLSGWGELRTFRPHLGRWDFEPYGLALSRKLVQQLGGSPVVYGDDATYERLATSEQAFFQQAGTRGPSRVIDWTIEREWRVPDDVDLRRFGVNDAFVFVPNREAAEVAAGLSRWPVYVLPGEFTVEEPTPPLFAIRDCEGLQCVCRLVSL